MADIRVQAERFDAGAEFSRFLARNPGAAGVATFIGQMRDFAPDDPIVFVATGAAHRGPAFDACAFIMDWLKTKAPFWKKEIAADGATGVAAEASDDAMAERWEKNSC